MKKYFYSILSLFLLLTGIGTANAAVGDVVTLANLSQDKSYKITCARGDLTLNSALTFPCSSTNDGKSTVDGADKWVVRNIGANYYLYNIAAKKFLASDNSLTAGPLALSIVASDQDGKYTIKGTDANANWLNNNNSGAFDIRNYKSNDPGNRIWFVEAGDFDGNFNGATFGNALTTITFNAKKNGNTVATEVLNNCVEGFTYISSLATKYPGAVLATPSATATASNQTINTTYTVDPAACPIKYSASFDDATWYKIKIQRSTAKYSSFDGTNITNTSGSEPTTALENMFAFVGDPFGFNLYNAKAGKNAPFGPASSAGGPNLSAATTSTAATLVYEVSTEDSNIKLLRNVDNEIGYLNDVNNKLGFWLSSNNRHDAGSNFAFIEVPEDVAEELVGKSIDITYNIYLGDNLIATKVVKENKNEAPTFDLSQYSSYVDISDMPTTITTAQTTYNIHSSYKSTFPISTDKWYNLGENRNPALQIYTTNGVTNRIETQAVAKTTETWDNYMWRFEGDWYNGFRIYNKAAEKYISYGNTTSPANNFMAYLTSNDELGSHFEYAYINNHHFFKVKGSTSARISNCGGPSNTFLTNWNAIDNNDAGSQILITECEELQDDDITLFTEALNAALATVGKLGNVPALYSSDAITTATNALNAIECTTSSQVDAAILQIAPIINTLYASANGKMFAARSVHDTNHSYLSATNEGYVAATKTELKADVVFKLEYINNENKYYIKGLYNNVYVSSNLAWNNAVPTAEEAGSHKFIVGNLSTDASTSNQVYFATQLSGYNAVHFTTSYTDYHTCSWSYDAGASQWTIEAVSDEQWEALSTTPDWEGLQTIVEEARSYPLGEGLGKYRYLSNSDFDLTEGLFVATLETIEEDLNGPRISTYSDIESYKTNLRQMIDALSINTPTPGSFLVIQGTTGSKYMNGRTLSTDPTVMWYGEDKKLVTYSTGLGFVNTSYDATVNDEFNTQTFAKAQTLGTYFIISNATGVGQYMYENTNNVDRYSTDAHERKRWNVSYATSIPVTISDAGLATLYSPVALEIPANVKAYGSTETADGVIKFEEITGIIPAKTGVIIEGEPNTYDFNITTGGTGSSTLVGTATTTATVANAYTLQKKNNVLGFYKYSGETLKGFKSYLTLGSGSNGFVIALPGDDLTGMNDATTAAQAGTYVDLLGNPTTQPQKGQLYIHNGQLIKY